MGFSLPHIPYPPAGDGFWSPTTATLNWCEEDYYATVYAAEVVNTLTNLYFVYLAARGIRNCRRNGHDAACQVAFFNMLFIGVGSILFHMTLDYYMQLLDELSMIYLTSTTFYASFSFRRSQPVKLAVLAFTICFSAFVTLYYHYLKDPVFHQNAFAILAATVIFRGVYDMERTLRPSRRTPKKGVEAAEQRRIDARDERILRTMWLLAFSGVASVGLGFLIWNLDNIFCSNLRRWRRELGLPWGILLEGHGWCLIWTALAAYYNLVWLSWLRYCLRDEQDEVELRWPSLFTSLPLVYRKSRSEAGLEDRKTI